MLQKPERAAWQRLRAGWAVGSSVQSCMLLRQPPPFSLSTCLRRPGYRARYVGVTIKRRHVFVILASVAVFRATFCFRT